jgi:hypothetical protein
MENAKPLLHYPHLFNINIYDHEKANESITKNELASTSRPYGLISVMLYPTSKTLQEIL